MTPGPDPAPMPDDPRPAPARDARRRALVVAALGLVLALGVFVRRGPIDYNLPVASNVDERISLTLLQELGRGGLDPDYFHYPSFYYYINYFVLRPFDDVGRILRQGRILNLVFGCGLALATYAMTRAFFASRVAGLIAAALAMFSPILVESGAYVITDVLMALLVTCALVCFGRYVERGSLRWWLAALVLSGAAISSKYSALVLIPFYLLLEYAYATRLRERIGPAPPRAGSPGLPALIGGLVRRELAPRTLALASAALAVVLLAVGLFFPEEFLLRIVESRQELDSTLDEADRAFLASVARGILALGVGAGGFAAFCFLRPQAARRFTALRPWLGAAAMVAAFVAGSPFIVVSWKAFLFDFGYELKANQLSGDERLWFRYIRWMFLEDSGVALVSAGVGLACVVARARNGLVLVLFLVIAYLSVGSATRGAERYLAPLLPVVYALAALGIVSAARGLRALPALRSVDRRGVVPGVFVGLAVLAIAVELGPRVRKRIAQRTGFDEMHASYRFVTGSCDVDRVFWAGHVPLVELEEQGFATEQVPLSWLSTGSSFATIGPRDLVLLDGASFGQLGAGARGALELVWSAEEGYGQYALRRSADSG